MSSYEEEAHRAWESGDLAGAFRCFRLGANGGQLGCMIDLGYFYDEGIGTLRSKHDAMRWYKRAFANGDSAAASNIAILFRERGNHRRMFRWFIAAARRDDGDALVEVAKCYQMGLGVPRSTMMTIVNARKALRSRHLSIAGREEALGLLAAL
jgi:uncharacterized protein